MSRITSLSSKRALAALASIVVALAGPGSARAEAVAPQIELGPTTVLNGLAVVSGTVTRPSSGAELSVNGQPLELTAAGTFAGVVNLSGQSVLSLSLREAGTGYSSTVTIPLTTNFVGLGGVVTPNALDALEQAAVTVLKPVEGFVSVDDEPIEVAGGMGNGDKLTDLSVNGIDALSQLGADGSFRVPVPGTTREISLFMADKQGVSLDTRYRTARRTSWIAAQDADGVRITKIRYFAKGVRRTKRVRMVVTVRDRRNLLINGAVVTVRSARSRRIVGRAKVRSTNLNGKATFVLRLRRAAFGKRLSLVTTASTPHAKATKRSSVRMPRLPSAARR